MYGVGCRVYPSPCTSLFGSPIQYGGTSLKLLRETLKLNDDGTSSSPGGEVHPTPYTLHPELVSPKDWCRVKDLGSIVKGVGCGVWNEGCGVQGVGCRV